MYIQEEKERNWNKKETSSEKAKRHVKEMEERYPNEIAGSVYNTRQYAPGLFPSCFINFPMREEPTVIRLVDVDTVSAVFEFASKEKKTAVLNFASFKHPGGMFLEGSMAQEEALCHESTLYNVLCRFTEFFYKPHEKCLNKALYTDDALYSESIVFEREEKRKADVITIAAPNKTAASFYQKVPEEQVNNVMEKRIEQILHIAQNEKCDTLILGAFGCGVFGNDPEFVANAFHNLLNAKFKDVFSEVIFAVPTFGKANPNYEAFKKVFPEK